MINSRSMGLVGALALAVLCAANARATELDQKVIGTVTAVNDSPFSGGTPTQGIAVNDLIVGKLTWDDTTGQASGGFISYELTALTLTVPDTTQVGDSFEMIPAALNSATRIVYSGGAFQGLVLPNNVTGFENIDAFGLTGAKSVDFESSGFLGPDFKFNLGTPVVEGTFAIFPVHELPVMGPVGIALFLVALGGSGIWAARHEG